MTWYAVGRGTAKTASGEDWSHGTAASQRFDRFDFDKNKDDYEAAKHWNSHLGAHFTSEHEVAAEIAHNNGGRVIHATLAMKNPKHYDSEFDMDKEGFHWAVGQGYLPKPRTVSGDDDVVSEHAASALRHHSHIKEIAAGFKEHLQDQGHDGITYGNEFEGPNLHKCAIAFHPDDIKITSQHWTDQHCPDGTICPACGHSHTKQFSGQCNNCGADVDWHDQHPVSLAKRVQQDSYSTAFTAPGFWHDYSHPDEPKTAALHDISRPGWTTDTWGKSDEEKQALQDEHTKAHAEFRDKVRKEKGWGADEPADHEVHKEWERGMRSALTTGKIDINEAEKRGYEAGGQHEHGSKISTYQTYGHPDEQERRGGWKPLPKYVHHVSTDVDAVMGQGLKTRDQLGQKYGKGLGGGSDDTVSVTSDATLAPDIYHALHEHHAAATGKISPQQLLHYAEHPPEGMKPFDGELKGSHLPEHLDALMRGVKVAHNVHDPEAPMMQTKSEAAVTHPGWSAVEESKVKGGRPQDESMYTHWERPLTKDEHTYQRSQFYKNFSTARQHGGGHRDPLFMSNDPVAFAKSDPQHFGILHLRSQPGAQGYPLNTSTEGAHHEGADSGEWRLGEGSPFDVMSVERPTPRHLAEFGGGSKTASTHDEMPPDPGTVPIPKGHVRLWHYTGLWNKDSIKEHGLMASHAHGDGGTGPNEASSGVWASTRAPEDWQRALHVEFHAPLSEISDRADDPWREASGLDEPGSFGKGYHHVIMKGDVKPSQIVGLHEPWHASVRDIRDNGGPDQYDDLFAKRSKEPTGHQDIDDAVRAYHYLKGQQGKTAKVRHSPKSDEPHTGIMIALVPPAFIIENLHLDEGEPTEEMHITMAYLGDTDEYSEALLDNLHEVVSSWAEGQAKFTALVQGVGTFLPSEEDGQHVLWASIGAPGLHRTHSSLVDYLKGHGYDPRENHGFTPHLTLAYGNTHFRFMPKVKRQTFKVHEVWLVIAGRWESITLGTNR